MKSKYFTYSIPNTNDQNPKYMLGKIHFYLGIIIIITFLLTGQYMHHNYNHLKDMELMQRALFRAGHLYILLFGLINVTLGIHFKIDEIKWIKNIQYIASLIVFFASFLIIYSFFKEMPAIQIERPMTRNSLYLIFLGVTIHGLISIVMSRKIKNNKS